MHTTGLVLTLVDDCRSVRSTLAELSSAGPIHIGESYGLCWSAVLEASDPKDAHDWHDWVAALPGIESVEVVFVHWDDTTAIEGPDARE